MLAAGCYGIGALWPTAQALRRAGNRVITVLDYLVYWGNRYRRVTTRCRFSRDPRIGGGEYVAEKIKRPWLRLKKIDRVMAVGCTAFMRSVSSDPRPAGIKTIVSLNPSLVDGTGMCGACRCTAAGKTKFACVDGPGKLRRPRGGLGRALPPAEIVFRRGNPGALPWEKENLP